MTLRLRLFAFALLGLAPARSAGAQSVLASREGSAVDSLSSRWPFLALRPFAPVSNDVVARVATPVEVKGAPLSYQIVAIPLPSDLPRDRPISYEVLQSGGVPILGNLYGVVRADAQRTVLLTLPVPGSTRAGTVPIAMVRFSADGATPVDVPVRLTIAPFQRIELRAMEGLRAVQPGGLLTLGFRVLNMGNVADSVEVRVITPAGWQVAGGPNLGAIALGVHEAADRMLNIRLPLTGPNGSLSVRLIALVHGQPVSTVDIPVQVLLQTGATRRGGPVLTTGVGVAAGPGGPPIAAFTAAIDGQLTDGIQISGHTSFTPGYSDRAAYGLARAGLFPAPSALELTARGWRAGLGLIGPKLSDLTGTALSGEGAAFELTPSGWKVSAFAAEPRFGRGTGNGVLTGGRIETHLGGALFSGAVSHLDEQEGQNRRLDALALGASVPGIFAGALSTEVAQRWFAGGAGLGWSAEYTREHLGNRLRVRISDAPGGIAAFARARHELSAEAGQKLTSHLGLSGNYWRTSDDPTSGFSALVSSGWSFGGDVRPLGGLDARLDFRGYDFSAATAAGRFGSSETSLGASVNAHRGSIFGTVEGTFGKLQRMTGTAGTTLVEAALRSQLRAALGVSSARGFLQLTARIDQTGTGAGYLPRQAQIGIRADHVQLLTLGGTRLSVNGSLDRLTWFGDRGALTAASAGFSAEFASGSVTLGAERNPYVVNPGSTGAWFYGVRFERKTGFARLGHNEVHGVVFQDLNGNGSRDPGEPGLAAVMVRRGDEVAATSADGSFRLSEGATDDIAIDPLSLPMGWIVGKTRTVGKRLELGTVAVASVEFTLDLAEETQGRITAEELARVVVLATDGKGRTWAARTTSSGRAVFEALPPGQYRVQLDFADIVEPLSASEKLPNFEVGTGTPVQRFRIMLRSRPFKLQNFGAAGRGANAVSVSTGSPPGPPPRNQP